MACRTCGSWPSGTSAASGRSPPAAAFEAGFAFDNDVFALPRQWGFTARGLVLHYNAGEVAPPKLGPTTILAPWNELRGIIKARAGILPR